MLKKYEVYLTTGETINLEADEVYVDFINDSVRFIENEEVFAFFTLSNICGYSIVDEFADEEADEG